MNLSPFVRRCSAVLVAMSLSVGVAACGGSSRAAAPTKISTLDPHLIPGDMLGLSVKTEATTKAESLKRPFIDAVGLYSLRKSDLLQATLQVARFSKSANYRAKGFQGTLVSQIGSTEPKIFRMGSQTVYLTTGRRQSVAIWFKGRYFFVLSSRDDYATPRSLLRTALEINP